ncbi:MAG: tetratricopeptide repeat protein [Magnetococcales bacterium]|nr:tetratricopeptide repeat protein [Magnetococcales bacterium]
MNHPTIPTLIDQAISAHQRCDPARMTALLKEVLALDPENADALYLLGMNASRLNRPDLAVNLISKAIALKPNNPYYHFNLAACLTTLGQTAAAAANLRQTIALKPDLAEAHVNLGNLLQGNRDHEAALACYRQALGINPALTVAHYNWGVILQESGDHAGALERFDAALRCDPESATAHLGRAASLLKTGRMTEGWEEYAWRFRLPNHAPRLCPVPRWDGSDPAGLRIYLYTEQGFGDALMFARFAPRLKALGATVLLECRPELHRLLAASALADQVSARSLDDGAPPPFDYDRHLPLLCLPRLLGITLENLPDHSVPYLTPPAARIQAWAARLGPKTGLRIGLSWSGNPEAVVNRDRACTLQDLLPLTTLPGVTCYSLQKGTPAAQLTAEWQQRHAILPLADALDDFTETAAALCQLDLLISTDTAIVHLAGGLGVPVWTLLHTACEWRWLESGHTSPWYPAMRLFRQPVLGDWSSVVEQVRASLDELRPGHSLA